MGTSSILFAMLGVVGKLLGGLLSAWLQAQTENRRLLAQERIAHANRTFEPNFDTASDSSAWTRRCLALMVVFTASSIAAYGALYPAPQFTVLIPKVIGITEWLFGSAEQAQIQVSLGWFTMRYFELAFMACGFYFTPVSSGASKTK